MASNVSAGPTGGVPPWQHTVPVVTVALRCPSGTPASHLSLKVTGRLSDPLLRSFVVLKICFKICIVSLT